MGALENITERIKKDASNVVQKRIKEAEKEAEVLLDRAKKDLAREKAALELETGKAMKIQGSRAISEAKLEARKALLSAKEEVISSAFEMANERLANLGSKETESYLTNAIKNAVGILGSDVEVLCNSKDSKLVSKIVSSIDNKISVSSEGIEYIGGAVIRAKDGSSQIDATLEGVLARIKNELRKEVAEILFKGK